MPLQEFALDATGTRRVQVFQGTDLAGGALTVLLDQSIIGTVSQEEFVTGREIPLKDGSVLKVQKVNDQVQVLRDGVALPSVATKQALTGRQQRTMSSFKTAWSIISVVALFLTLLATHTFLSGWYVLLGIPLLIGLWILGFVLWILLGAAATMITSSRHNSQSPQQ